MVPARHISRRKLHRGDRRDLEPLLLIKVVPTTVSKDTSMEELDLLDLLDPDHHHHNVILITNTPVVRCATFLKIAQLADQDTAVWERLWEDLWDRTFAIAQILEEMFLMPSNLQQSLLPLINQ
jgi:hypothetical protein